MLRVFYILLLRVVKVLPNIWTNVRILFLVLSRVYLHIANDPPRLLRVVLLYLFWGGHSRKFFWQFSLFGVPGFHRV